MLIAGLQKLTLLDYPGRTAASIFTLGCDFRCPFCHNADLVIFTGNASNGTDDLERRSASSDPRSNEGPAFGTAPLIPEHEFFAFLRKRKGLLDGICISGGEPTLQRDLLEFCTRIKEEGFLIKLDTNGSRPSVLQDLLDSHLIDFVAMDIKNDPEHYAHTIGVIDGKRSSNVSGRGASFDFESIETSMALILRSSITFEFRTTILKELHTERNLIDTASWIAATAQHAQRSRTDVPWFIQNFVDSPTILGGEGCFHAWSETDLQEALPKLQDILPLTKLRGDL